jgi:anti-sigma regulatory factor (Ser/Thr protein kinase)
MLQRSLMPERLPLLPDVELAARYLPGTEELKVGGDWYDVLALPDHRVLLAIGDVVGHGVRAASSMGRIRSALELCALDGMSPGAALTRLNRYSWAREDAEMATLLLVLYDPGTTKVTMASAGHPPPLVLRPNGPPEYLEVGGGAPLGAVDTPLYPEVHAELPPGTRLFLFTDGLVERRGESLDAGLRRLAQAVERGPEKLDELADQLLADLLGGGGPADDVALLVVRTLASADSLALRCPARPNALGPMRDRVRDWLVALGAGPTEREELILAVNEAAANAVEHAYGLEEAVFTVDGRLDGETVVIRVRDSGEWQQQPTPSDRGRGLGIMRSLTDDVQVEHEESGTEIVLWRRLRREPDE